MIFKIVYLFLLTSHSSSMMDTTNKEACIIVERHLKVIKDYLNNYDSDPSLRRVSSIYFLEELTGITSESDGTNFGKMSPTKIDYAKWDQWYKRKKNLLRLNKTINRVYVGKAPS